MTDDPFDIDELLGIAASPQIEARRRALPIPLEGDRMHKRKPARRLFHNAARTEAAIDALNGLPAAGETWHVLMPGAYDSFDLIDAMLEHAAPATIEALHLASLGFNARNAKRLLKMMDADQVGRCTLTVCVYYEAEHNERDTCYLLAQELPRRGGWYVATRSHCKIIAARFTDGRCYVIESSANLRSCRNLEQFTITHDAALFDFHRVWLQEVYEVERQRREIND